MKKLGGLFIVLLLAACPLKAQAIDPDLEDIRQRLDSIEGYSAHLILEEDISFIDMPKKQASIVFEKGKRLEIESEDFVLLPRRGMDLSLSELFKYPFITVQREPTVIEGKSYKTVNIIPTETKADFSIALLYLDVANRRVAGFELTTKEEGTFNAILDYPDKADILPSRAVISFQIDRLRIPINFMGKDTEIDRRALREDQPKTGRIILNLTDYAVRMKGD
jgi:hypothetical protein